MEFPGITPAVPKLRNFRDSSNHRTIGQNIVSSTPVSSPRSDFLSVSVKVNTLNGINVACWESKDIDRYVTPRTCHNRAHCTKISSHPRGRVENVHNPTTHARIPEVHLSELRWPEGKVIKRNSFPYHCASVCCEAEGFNLYLNWLILGELPDRNSVCSLFVYGKRSDVFQFWVSATTTQILRIQTKSSGAERMCEDQQDPPCQNDGFVFAFTARSNRELETRAKQ